MALGLRSLLHALLLLALIVALALVIAKGQLAAVLGLAALPLIAAYLIALFKYPVVGLYSVLLISFVAIGITRYTPAPIGLAVDALLILTFLAEVFKRFDALTWPVLRKNPVMIILYIWCLYCLAEIANPEARSIAAWFYAMRAMVLYPLLIVLLVLELMNRLSQQHFDRFLTIWLTFSCVAALYGMKQLFVGLDGAEKAWLDAGNASTHILHGKLRVFSFYSDAGQFGAATAHAGLVALIMSLGPFSIRKKIFLTIAALLCLYGMAISGTRGALFVPIAGFASYLVLGKNFKLLIVGGLMAGSIFGVLKFTMIGQSNYQIQRMRSALDPNDPSLLVRIENQKKLSTYLASRPIGGGIGSAGYWGLRFSPNTVLAQTPTDSWYVKIWAETGIIGLLIHVGMLLFFLGYFFKKLWLMPPSPRRQQSVAIYAGVVGIVVASYGNQVLGQLPTSTAVYMSIAFLYLFTHNPLRE
ncbi:O-antigen ligase [Rhabdobacter roseus]|uniref:O-antigen ligase n=1 Tax=Rhabdobacter roseus TaxID=1655419 RepID=A0A840TTN1_9BACT|nr:O-antigen ligase family protein [Rhabdobacter roseus]MBB5287311.1 O-antigen ligase [Rhabdobacter roseus]